MKDLSFSRVSADQQRAMVATGPRSSRQCRGATPCATSRNVQSGAEPIMHLADASRTT